MYRIAEKKRIKLEKKKFQRKRLGRIKCVSVMDRLATQRHASPCNHEATLQRNIRVERVKNRRSRPRGEMNFLCNARLYATHVAATPCLHVVTLLRVRKVAARSTIHDSPRNRRRHPTQDSTRNDVSSQVENSWGRKKKKEENKKGEKKRKTSKHANGVIPSPDDLVTI